MSLSGLRIDRDAGRIVETAALSAAVVMWPSEAHAQEAEGKRMATIASTTKSGLRLHIELSPVPKVGSY